jgi:hypothetical protein
MSLFSKDIDIILCCCSLDHTREQPEPMVRFRLCWHLRVSLPVNL